MKAVSLRLCTFARKYLKVAPPTGNDLQLAFFLR
jgi:hypothetical protein